MSHPNCRRILENIFPQIFCILPQALSHMEIQYLIYYTLYTVERPLSNNALFCFLLDVLVTIRAAKYQPNF